MAGLRKNLPVSSSFLAFCAAGAVSMAGLGGIAHAQSLQQALQQTTISGDVGVSDFTYANDGHSSKTKNDFAVGGDIIIHTGAIDGFSAGFGGYTGQSLGIYSKNPNHDDSELTSPTHSIQSLREAYLQYVNSYLEVRGGRQMINTPYANQDWYTFSPRAYMGFAGTINILGQKNTNDADSAPLSLETNPATLSVFAARIFNTNLRYSSSFISGNRYMDHSNGFITFGARYQNNFDGTNVGLQGWYYDFYGLAQLTYSQADFSTALDSGRSLFGAAQMVTEGNSGSGSRVQDMAGQKYNIDAHIYGAKLGMAFANNDQVALIGDYSPQAKGSFRHGGLVHPYNDNSGTVFTDTMQTGIGDFGPGYAYGITGTVYAFNNQLKINPTYVEYNVDYGCGGNIYSYDGAYGFPSACKPMHDQAIHVVDVGFNYDMSRLLKGLSFTWNTDAAFAQNDSSATSNHYNNPYFSSRLYLNYKF